jgi:predicted Zn-dependent protease with MMP-like domain
LLTQNTQDERLVYRRALASFWSSFHEKVAMHANVIVSVDEYNHYFMKKNGMLNQAFGLLLRIHGL